MSLSKGIEESKKDRVFAEENVEEGAIETLNGRRGRKNQAVERLKTLKLTYRQDLMESAAFIVVTGDKREEFETLARDSFACFSANPNALYEDLANRIPEALYHGKESASGIFDVLGRHLEDKARELGIIGYPQMI